MTQHEVLAAYMAPEDTELLRESLRQSIPGGAVPTLHVAEDVSEVLRHLFGSDDGSPDAEPECVPKLIILGVSAHDPRGRSVLQALATNGHVSSVPVVVFCAEDSMDAIAESYEAGATSYVIRAKDVGERREAVRLMLSYWLAINLTLSGVPSVDANWEPR